MSDALEGRDAEEIRALPAIGIDLGTSTSAIAILDEEGRPYLLADDSGDVIVPSIVQAHEGELIVGMLSVNASSGAVWNHWWHGTFVAISE